MMTHMPKGLVVYLDDETYKRLKVMSINEGESLKDLAYDIIKGIVDCTRDPKELLEEYYKAKTQEY